MSPTPVTFVTPNAPATYSWEATDQEIATRYGVDPSRIVRFDLNTSPAPPSLIAGLLAAGRFEAPLSEYPPTDYRRLVEAAAARYGVEPAEIIVGAGADEILDIVAKAAIPTGGHAVVPTPTYAMYRVLTEQRGASVVAVPRRPSTDAFALDPVAIREAVGATHAAVVWLCSPNNPTALPEPDGLVAELLTGLIEDAASTGRERPLVILDEAYAEFVGTSLADLRDGYPELVTIRTASKAYALAGLRVGFGIARPELIARLNPFRPPGSISTVSVTLVTEALLDPAVLESNLARVARERRRLTDGLRAVGWSIGPSVTNFVLADLGSNDRAARIAEGLLSRGLVPRTFGAGHPLSDHLRLTVRDPEENDRLIAAAAELAEQSADLAPPLADPDIQPAATDQIGHE